MYCAIYIKLEILYLFEMKISVLSYIPWRT